MQVYILFHSKVTMLQSWGGRLGRFFSLNPRYVCDEAKAIWNEPNDPNYDTELVKVS